MHIDYRTRTIFNRHRHHALLADSSAASPSASIPDDRMGWRDTLQYCESMYKRGLTFGAAGFIMFRILALDAAVPDPHAR